MKKYEYVQNMKKYVQNMKEYEEICRLLDFALPYLYGPWDLGKFRIRASFKALELRKSLSFNSYRLRDL